MPDYRHPNVAELAKRMREEPRSLILVTGPRQTGKTTAVLQALKEAGLRSHYEPVDMPFPTAFLGLPDNVSSQMTPFGRRDQQWLIRLWESARNEALRFNSGFVLVIDEIQQIPGWARTVKGLWDRDRRNGSSLRVAILASAPLLMQQDLGESLVGRFETLQFTHWSYTEMSEAFEYELDRYVYFGGSPGAARFRDPIRWRQFVKAALVEPVIQRDVLAITRVDKPTLLRQVFEFGVRQSGQILSFNKMLGQLQDAGNTTTLARYLELLSRVGMLGGLSKYSGSFIQVRRSSPKLNVLNTAYVGAFSDLTFEQAPGRSDFLGASGRERSRRASLEYRPDRRYSNLLLERPPFGGGFRSAAGPTPRSRRSQERPADAEHTRPRRILEQVPARQETRCRSEWRALVRVPECPGEPLGRGVAR